MDDVPLFRLLKYVHDDGLESPTRLSQRQWMWGSCQVVEPALAESSGLESWSARTTCKVAVRLASDPSLGRDCSEETEMTEIVVIPAVQ
jgi:hypothetical protein